MELLASNFPPIKTTHKRFNDTFYQLIGEAKQLNIAVGYISESALIELMDIVRKNRGPYCNLVIGMHYFDNFTYSQFAAAKDIENFLKENSLGSVKLLTSFPYHGKVYSFLNSNGFKKAILGSSNLNNILKHQIIRQYELDLLIDDEKINDDLSRFINKLIDISPELSSPELEIKTFKKTNNLMEDLTGVKKIEEHNLLQIIKSNLDYGKSISIPLKTAETKASKSNLNAYFGKGRENSSTSIIRRRPWYEVELIVPKKITNLAWYPKAGYPDSESVIDVITDDGYQFRCKISGTNSKNLRSDGDLKILGKWIKGRLENAGVLKVGELITNKVLEDYGRNFISMTPTKDLSIWYLDFEPYRE
ncbi:TPA: NgoFVII family restriction endonuclease [Legionella pneumophila subsp. pneumophila]|uniref:restriction endonuclease PLD domain-containing protein n=1 Tax=Legionella pneumophila TaxID=446 RepID=UPI0009836DE4|nr:restriction endonuclease PLD domain-containing protein [Legionella pneumophila]OOK43012.1 restriction endonuclease R.NgoVII [Legionella pneumophila subsp. pneumophila str. Mississauga]HAT9588944.1 NgoFVII family restriction endonuclease [Legionella pneumophila subsp. pneumophila]HAU1836305.1 NgoFVII family restriction endonuclease [Legionella pneumophila]HDP0035375.1 NgoFVII family restriction endonuclease [Legionella pneumophila]